MGKAIDKKKIKTINRMYAKGEPITVICSNLKISSSTLFKHLEEESKELRPVAKENMKIPLKNNIMKLYKEGLEIKEISKRLGISSMTIFRYVPKSARRRYLSKYVYNYNPEPRTVFGDQETVHVQEGRSPWIDKICKSWRCAN